LLDVDVDFGEVPRLVPYSLWRRRMEWTLGGDNRTGSISVGKVADLVLLEADALRNAAGFPGRPK
jgi:predicted amidohydrolase YtcJ